MKVDDSVLLRRGIIRKPSSFDKIRNDTVWLLGGYRKLTQRCSFLRESNIKIYTSCNAIKGEILLESTVFSNGYSLYPSVSRNLFFDHRVATIIMGLLAVMEYTIMALRAFGII